MDYMREFFDETGNPICISEKSIKPLIKLPKILKLIINMHDSIEEKYLVGKDKSHDITRVNNEIKYTMATSPTKCILFEPNFYNKMEKLFFTKGSLYKKTKIELRRSINKVNEDFIQTHQREIENLQEEKEQFKIFSNELKEGNHKHTKLFDDIKSVDAILQEIRNNIEELKREAPVVKTRKILIPGKLVKLNTNTNTPEDRKNKIKEHLIRLYNEFWDNYSGFLKYIYFDKICRRENLDETLEIKIVIDICIELERKYNILREGNVEQLSKFDAYKEIDAKILEHHHETMDINTIDINDYTFKTITDKQCIQDKLLSVITGNERDNQTHHIYNFGFNAVPDITRNEEDRFIDFFIDFVRAKQDTVPKDIDADNYSQIMLKLDTDISTKHIIDLLQSCYGEKSYPLNIEKRPDCILGTFIYEYIKELVISKYIEIGRQDDEILKLFFDMFSIDHPGNRKKNVIGDMFEGIYYNSEKALSRRQKYKMLYEVDKSELIFLFANLCENLDILDNACKYGSELNICEAGYENTPYGSPTEQISENVEIGSKRTRYTVKPKKLQRKKRKTLRTIYSKPRAMSLL